MVVDSRSLRRLASLGSAFRPRAPIDQAALFSGRQAQIATMTDAIVQTGCHAILYGERGVGKTSLARVLRDFLSPVVSELEAPHGSSIKWPFVVAFATCDVSDDYSSIWHKAFAEISVEREIPGVGYIQSPQVVVSELSSHLPKRCKPVNVLSVVREISDRGQLVVIIFDEFDQIKDVQTKTLMASTVKLLSDQVTNATIVLVGVADTVTELIGQHPSIERSLMQVPLPRMAANELAEIVHKGLTTIEMTIEGAALQEIVMLSQGLPHYTHVLGQAAARSAIMRGATEVTSQDVSEAIEFAVKNSQESVSQLYHTATFSTKRTLYPQVLLACALTGTDDKGFFAAGDLRKPLSIITNKSYDVPLYSTNLHTLTTPERGSILEQRGVPKRYRYRFVNPLVQPYIVMRGLTRQEISEEHLKRLWGTRLEGALQSTMAI